MSSTELLHQAHNRPEVPECHPVSARCWQCGGPCTRGMSVDRWMGENFTGHTQCKAPQSDTVCEACVWTMAGRPPDCWRFYSTLLEGSQTQRLGKGDKPAIRAFLQRRHREPWFAAISDSGQKHTVPYAPVNAPGTRRPRVYFEDGLVTLGDLALMDDASELLTLGATKGEVESGQYTPRSWEFCGRDAIERFEAQHGHERGGGWMRLAVWLAQRDEERSNELRNERQAGRARGVRPDPGAPAPVSSAGSEPHEPLGADRHQARERGEALPRSEVVAVADDAQPADLGPVGQLGLGW